MLEEVIKLDLLAQAPLRWMMKKAESQGFRSDRRSILMEMKMKLSAQITLPPGQAHAQTAPCLKSARTWITRDILRALHSCGALPEVGTNKEIKQCVEIFLKILSSQTQRPAGFSICLLELPWLLSCRC